MKSVTIKEAQRSENEAQEYIDKGDHYLAGAYYTRAIELYENLGNNHKAMEMYDKSIVELEQVAQEWKNKGDHEHGSDYYRVAQSYAKLGNNEKSRQMYEKAAVECEQSAQELVRKGDHANVPQCSH